MMLDARHRAIRAIRRGCIGLVRVWAMLVASHLTKSYAGVRALADASLDVRAGEIHALVGENGAGKSTLVRILTGATAPDAGSVVIDGHAVDRFAPVEARRLGVVAIHQHPALFPDLSVAENLALGAEPGGAFSRVDWPRATGARARGPGARGRGHRRGPRGRVAEPARTAARGDGARAERARAVADPRRADGVAHAARSGSAVRAAERAARARASPSSTSRTGWRSCRGWPTASRCCAMDGRWPPRPWRMSMPRADQADGRPRGRVRISRSARSPSAEPVLEVEGVSSREAGVSDISLTVRRGEIVGLAGLVGAGRTELARVLFGLDDARRRIGARRRPGGASALAGGGHRRRHRVSSRRPPPSWRGAGPAGLVEPHAGVAGADLAAWPARPRRRARDGDAPGRGAVGEDRVARHARPAAVGRQPAEGRAGPLARAHARRADPRRAHAGRGRRAPRPRSTASSATSRRKAWACCSSRPSCSR